MIAVKISAAAVPRAARNAQAHTWHRKVEAQKGNGARGIDENEIEDNVEQAHHGVEDTWKLHVAATAQHGRSQDIELEDGDNEAEDGKVGGTIAPYGITSAEPYGQMRTYENAQQAFDNAEHERSYQSLAQHIARALFIVCANEMGHLNGEAHTDSITKAREKPNTGANEPDTGTGVRAKMSHHRGINIVHHDGGYLRHHSRQTEAHKQLQLLPARHLSPCADSFQQSVGLCCYYIGHNLLQNYDFSRRDLLREELP